MTENEYALLPPIDTVIYIITEATKSASSILISKIYIVLIRITLSSRCTRTNDSKEDVNNC
jgi:hypothetical protein